MGRTGSCDIIWHPPKQHTMLLHRHALTYNVCHVSVLDATDDTRPIGLDVFKLQTISADFTYLFRRKKALT